MTPDPLTTIEVLAPGNHVWIGIENDWIPARILRVSLRPGGVVTYEVVWWCGRERNYAEVGLEELRRIDPQTVAVGFAS